MLNFGIADYGSGEAHRVNVRISDVQHARLLLASERVVKKYGRMHPATMSQMIRAAIDLYLDVVECEDHVTRDEKDKMHRIHRWG